jgi:hypothetical protein
MSRKIILRLILIVILIVILVIFWENVIEISAMLITALGGVFAKKKIDDKIIHDREEVINSPKKYRPEVVDQVDKNGIKQVKVEVEATEKETTTSVQVNLEEKEHTVDKTEEITDKIDTEDTADKISILEELLK